MENKKEQEILYSADDADALTRSEQTESWRFETDRKKAELILENADGAQSLLDIGCAWGQILRQLAGKIPTLAGVDESPERLAQLEGNALGIKTYRTSADALDIDDGAFDIVLTSHIVHEFKLFGDEPELMRILGEIKRVLSSSGRYFIIDHLDPGEGLVTINLPDDRLQQLKKFAEDFRYRKIELSINGNDVVLSKRDCQDFVTKIWSFGGGAEELEMKETHTVMRRNELEKDLAEGGFRIEKWITFNPITDIMRYYSVELVEGDDWDRQFMSIAKKYKTTV